MKSFAKPFALLAVLFVCGQYVHAGNTCVNDYGKCRSSNQCCSNDCSKDYSFCVPRPRGYKSIVTIGGKDYHFAHQKMSWRDAYAYCLDRNMTLLCLENNWKLQTLTAYLECEGFRNRCEDGSNTDNVFWTNGMKWRGKYVFTWGLTGKPIDSSLLVVNKLDRHMSCVEFGNGGIGKLTNNFCTRLLDVICEKPEEIIIPQKPRPKPPQWPRPKPPQKPCKADSCESLEGIEDNKKILITNVGNLKLDNINENREVGKTRILNAGNRYESNRHNLGIANIVKKEELILNLRNETGGIKSLNRANVNLKGTLVDNSRNAAILGR